MKLNKVVCFLSVILASTGAFASLKNLKALDCVAGNAFGLASLKLTETGTVRSVANGLFVTEYSPLEYSDAKTVLGDATNFFSFLVLEERQDSFLVMYFDSLITEGQKNTLGQLASVAKLDNNGVMTPDHNGSYLPLANLSCTISTAAPEAAAETVSAE